MHPTDIQAALDGMVIIVDTREQDTIQLHNRLKHFTQFERAKLNCGDYGAKFPVNGDWLQIPVVVERKMNIDELCQCFTRERKRFQREFERAAEDGVKTYLLLENTSFEQMYSHSYKSHMTPQALISSLLAWSIRYRLQVVMCREIATGRLIRDILYREGKAILERMAEEDE